MRIKAQELNENQLTQHKSKKIKDTMNNQSSINHTGAISSDWTKSECWNGAAKILQIWAWLLLVSATAWSQVVFAPYHNEFEQGPGQSDIHVAAGGLPPKISINDGAMNLTSPIQLDGFSLGLTTIQWGDW